MRVAYFKEVIFKGGILIKVGGGMCVRNSHIISYYFLKYRKIDFIVSFWPILDGMVWLQLFIGALNSHETAGAVSRYR